MRSSPKVLLTVQDLVRQIPGLLWTTDGELRFTSGHGLRMELLDLERVGGLLSEDAGFFGVQTHGDRILAAHRRALEGRTGRFEISVRGRIFSCLVEALRTPGEGVTGTVGLGVDVTERTRLDARLWREEGRYRREIERARATAEESQERLATVVQHAPVVLFVLDSLGRFVLSEGRGLRPLGLRPGEVVGDLVDDVYAEHPAILRDVRRTLAGEEVRSVHEVDGVVFDVRFAPIHDDDTGAVGGLIGVATDVTERRAAEERHRESEERYRVLFENATDVVSVLDPDGTIRYESPSAQDALGYHPEALEGTAVTDLVHPEDRPRVVRELEAVARDPERIARERFRIRHRDGDWRIVEAEARNLLGNPAVRGIVVNSRDVTERHKLEERLHQSQKMEALGRLAGGVAHDFNNLLTVIRGTAQLLREDGGSDEELDRGLAEIEGVADRAADLTRRLLTFSRRQIDQPAVVEMKDVLERSEHLLRRVLGADIDLSVEVDPELRVAIDSGRLEQVVVNLAVNARDAMPGGGRLSIRCRGVELEQVRMGSHHDIAAGRYALLTVADTGTGMSREVQQRVFEPFFTTKEEEKGTGLGLATVWGIVRQSGGVVHVYSEVGQGTSFRIYLPLVGAGEEVGPAVAEAQPSVPAPLAGTVLVAEDDPMVRRVVRRALERAGLEVLEAGDGGEALEVASAAGERLDVLLTDVVMPGMTGPELAMKIRERHPGLSILFSSGYGVEELRTRERELEAVRIVEKPFDLAALVEVVREVLPDGGSDGSAS